MFWVREYSYHFHFFVEYSLQSASKTNTNSRTTHQKQPPLIQPLYITNSFNAHSQFPLHHFLLHTFNLLINHNDNIRELTTPPNTAKTPQTYQTNNNHCKHTHKTACHLFMMYTAIYNANSPSRCSVEFVNCTPRVFLLLSSPFFFNTEPAIGCRDDDGSVAITAAGLEEHAPIFISLPWRMGY